MYNKKKIIKLWNANEKQNSNGNENKRLTPSNMSTYGGPAWKFYLDGWKSWKEEKFKTVFEKGLTNLKNKKNKI